MTDRGTRMDTQGLNDLFLMTNQRVWLSKDNESAVNISPAAAANPYT